MLVLSRKVGQSLVIGEDITLTIQSIKGDTIRVAIDAPKSVPILRGELKSAADANKEALNAGADAVNALKKQLGIKK